ncbi:hypothetical protein LTR62_007256 [Meristemomyces frigidus]|uniref:Uncharacterized protein n=1 Tax=Meristemomyces frigidus TaxID=1508187 RepID=A0AAN7TEL6_9PEZI|nr:hypothetical protein LTR62_007256 [Meristemomyces frigidus]
MSAASRQAQSRIFTTSAHLREETAFDDEVQKPKNRLRIIRDDGGLQERIVGKAGRRQRASIARLKTTSLGRPSDVIVLRDVVEEAVPAQAMERTVRGTPDLAPEQDTEAQLAQARQANAARALQPQLTELEEAMASVESLRPQHTVVDKQEIKALKDTLVKSYNLEQLAQYLSQSTTSPEHLHAELPIADTNAVSLWRPGRTPLEKRIGRLSLDRDELGKNKKEAAEKIIRNAWRLSTQGEVQQIGELEMYVKPWQRSFLFSMKRGNKQSYEHMIDSVLLARATDVRPYRPENVVRITGRKSDAEEVARNLQAGLTKVRHEQIDLNVFKPLLGTTGQQKSEPRRFKGTESPFRGRDLRFVSERTASVIRFEEDGKLNIYGAADHPQSTHARRLILSLLNLPSATQTTAIRLPCWTYAPTVKPFAKDNITDIVEWPAMDIHQKHRGYTWHREVVPASKLRVAAPQTQDAAAANITDRISEALTSCLSLPEMHQADCGLGLARWYEEEASGSWSARMGTLIKKGFWAEKDTRKRDEQKPHSSALSEPFVGARHVSKSGDFEHPVLFVDEALGTVPLLASMHPMESAIKQPSQQVLVHLLPSPFTPAGVVSMGVLPSLTLTFDINSTKAGHYDATTLSSIASIVATLERQEVHLPLPSNCADLCFSRSRAMAFDLSGLTKHHDLNQLVQSLAVALNTPEAVLPSTSDLNITLPSTFLNRTAGTKQETNPEANVKYFISHYEQVMTTDFTPNLEVSSPKDGNSTTPGTKDLATHWPRGMILRLRDIDAGPLAGRRSELLLMNCRTDGFGQDVVANGRVPVQTPHHVRLLARTAVETVGFMTRANGRASV